MVLGKRIAQARQGRGMTQEELANAVLVSKPTIERAEYNTHPLNADVLWRISKELGYPMEWFMFDPNEIDTPISEETA